MTYDIMTSCVTLVVWSVTASSISIVINFIICYVKHSNVYVKQFVKQIVRLHDCCSDVRAGR